MERISSNESRTKDVKNKQHLQLLQTILSFNKYEKPWIQMLQRIEEIGKRFVNIYNTTYKLGQLGNFLPNEKTFKKSPK